MDPIGYAVRQGFERAEAARARYAAVRAAETALAVLQFADGRAVAARLTGSGRAACDLARAIVAADPHRGTLGAVQVALSRWFRGVPVSPALAALALDTLDRWDAEGAPAVSEAARVGAESMRERLDGLDVPHARIAERAAMALGLRARSVVQALSHWINDRQVPSDRVAAAILAEVEAAERAESSAAAAEARRRAESSPLAPAGPTNPGIPGGLGALLAMPAPSPEGLV